MSMSMSCHFVPAFNYKLVKFNTSCISQLKHIVPRASKATIKNSVEYIKFVQFIPIIEWRELCKREKSYLTLLVVVGGQVVAKSPIFSLKISSFLHLSLLNLEFICSLQISRELADAYFYIMLEQKIEMWDMQIQIRLIDAGDF